MKTQIGANCVTIGSKALNEKNPKAVTAALTSAPGKRKMYEITVEDANGQVCTFVAPLRQFKGGSFGAFLSLKGEARIVEVDAPVGKAEQKEEKVSAKLQALTDELLAE